MKIWASGKVARVADGLTDKRSKRAQKILPAGALLWAWDADPEFNEQAGEQWLILLRLKNGMDKCSMHGGLTRVSSQHLAASLSHASLALNRTKMTR